MVAPITNNERMEPYHRTFCSGHYPLSVYHLSFHNLTHHLGFSYYLEVDDFKVIYLAQIFEAHAANKILLWIYLV